MMYSPTRYGLMKRMDLCERIKLELRENACPFEHDYLFDTATMSFKEVDGERGQKIPFTLGLLRRIRRLRPDVLITEGFFQWTPLVILYGLLFRKPVFIGYERTCYTERNCGKLKIWHRKLTDLFVSGYLVNGNETRKYLMTLGVAKEKIHEIGMSADSSGLRAGIAAMSEEKKIAMRKNYKHENGVLYLFCGALIPRKGVEPLLEAWTEHVKSHPSDTLVMVGGGELYDRIIERFGSEASVFIEGRKDYSKVCKYYAIADVFILPTIEDNWSLVIPEAMACGLPVATSVYNGCHEELIHEGENGCTFDTFDQASMLKALDYFHHVDLKAHGRKSIEIEKAFNTENCAKRLYESLNN